MTRTEHAEFTLCAGAGDFLDRYGLSVGGRFVNLYTVWTDLDGTMVRSPFRYRRGMGIPWINDHYIITPGPGDIHGEVERHVVEQAGLRQDAEMMCMFYECEVTLLEQPNPHIMRLGFYYDLVSVCDGLHAPDEAVRLRAMLTGR